MIDVEKINDVMVISFSESSKLNVTVTQKIKTEIIKAITPNAKVALNLSGIIYIDSTGFWDVALNTPSLQELQCLIKTLQHQSRGHGTGQIASTSNRIRYQGKRRRMH